MTEVNKIQIFKLSLPLNQPFITNKRTSHDMSSLIFKVILSDGNIGWGESAENINLTSVNLQGMFDFSSNIIEKITNKEIYSALNQVIKAKYNPAKYGLETALLDAFSQSTGKTISDLLDIAKPTNKLLNDTTVSIMNYEKPISYTNELIKKGYHCIKYKIGPGKDEVKRILALSNYLPKTVSIRIDPNQAWNKEEAFKFISILQKSTLCIDFIEQPTEEKDLNTLRELAKFSEIPIVADESIFSFQDAKTIVENQYANMLNIKLIKCGGPIEAVKIAKFADEHNVKCMFGCTSEANIAISMAAFLAASLPNVIFFDLDGLDFINKTPFSGGVVKKEDKLEIPGYLGLGIRVNEKSEYLNLIR